MTTLEAARMYLECELSPIPIPARKKNPARNGWPGLRFAAADLPRYFSDGTNVGILLGDDYGTADVDLDCQEAVAAAAELLPETRMIFGRKSRPASHYVYRADPPLRTKSYYDPLDKPLKGFVQLRCLKTDGTQGLQTVVPPSVHPEGEEVRFESGCDASPANIDADKLEQAVARVAAAALLARHWPAEKSGRNPAFLALAGCAARAGWSLDQAQTFIRAIYRALWGPEAKFAQASAEAKATFDKHARGAKTTAGTTLRTLLPPQVVAAALGWLGWTAPEPSPRPATVDVDQLAASLDLLNAMTVFDGRIRFSQLSRRGSMILATTDAGQQIIFPTMTDVASFARARACIADGADVLLPKPKKGEVDKTWDPAADLIVRLSAQDAVRLEPALQAECRDLLMLMWKYADQPKETDSPDFVEFLEKISSAVRDKERPPPPCVFLAEGYCWVHVPTLRNWLSLPTLTNRLYPLADIRTGLLLLGFEYEKDLTRRYQGKTMRASLWRGPAEVLRE